MTNPVLKRLQEEKGGVVHSDASAEQKDVVSYANPVLHALSGGAARDRAESQQKIYEEARKKQETSKPAEEEKPDLLTRVVSTLTGSAKRQAAGHAGTAESLLTGLGKLGSVLQDKKEARLLAQDKAYLAQHEKELADALAAGDEEAAKWAQIKINQAKYRIKTSGDMGDYYDEVNRKAVEDVDAFGDKMYGAAEQDFAKAKQGAGTIGKVAVDAGAVLADVATDAVGNMIVPGLGTAGRVSRTFGHGSEAAQEKGFGFGTQLGYGVASAAMGEAANRMFSGNPILQKATGKGALDDILLPNVGKTVGGRALKSGVGEAIEEGAERVADIGAQRLFFGDKADETTAKDVGYDALLGGIIGIITGGVSGNPVVKSLEENAPATPAQEPANKPAPNAAGERTASAPSEITPAQENAAQSLTVRGGNSGADRAQSEIITDTTVENPGIDEEADRIVSKNANLQREAVVSALPRAREVHSAAAAVQSKLNNLLDSIATRLGFAHAPDIQKSVDSIVSRIIRDDAKGKGGAPIKDAARGHMEMPSWDYLPRVLQALRDAKIPYTAEAKNTDQGYRGLHLTWDEDGVGIELQLSTQEAWAVKMKTEEIYAKWRDVDMTTLSEEQEAEYRADIQRSMDMWAACQTPDFTSFETSSGDRGVASMSSPPNTGTAGLTHSPETSSRSIGEVSAISNTRPSSVRTNLDIKNTPSGDATSTESVAQEGESVNDSQISTSESVNSVGAAEAGFETPNSRGHERISNLATGNMAYNEVLGEATARNRRDYNALFRYTTQTEEQSLHQADNLLYVLQDGERKFIRAVDEEAYQDMVRYLSDAPAWNSVMTDAAKLIETELRGRSVNGEITEDEFVKWIEVMREHATETGRGTQAWAKWTRRENESGRMTELEAWERIQRSNLSEEEKRALFRRILEIDTEIQTAQDEANLKRIILEIAEERGTLSGLTGRQSGLLHSVAEKSLDGMSRDQLVQFAYQSAAALSTDPVRADWGSRAKTIQILNMLSNPKTAARNLSGNTSFYALDAMSMRGAALLDMVLSKITGTRSVAWERSVLNRNTREDIARAIRLSLAEVTMDVDMGGESRYGTSSNRTFKADGNFAERAMSALERNMSYLMTTTDEAYKGAARSTEHATQALVDEGKIKTDNEEYASEQAENLALYRTFQGDGRVTTAIQQVHDILNMFVGIGDSDKRVGGKVVHSFGLGDMVAPFTRVAGNLASVGVDYSPVNAVKGTVEILDAIRNAAAKNTVDPARQAKAVSDFARGMTGSAIAYGVAQLAAQGLIRRADDEDDKDIADLNKSEGMTGTQVNVDAAKRWADGGSAAWKPGDTLVDVSSLEPINFIISLGVDLADNENDSLLSTFGDVETYRETVTSAAATAGDLPILSNVGEFAKDVMVYGNSPIEAGAEMLGKTAVSSVTPNIIAAFAKGRDNKQRNVYSSDKVSDVLVDYFKSRVPGLREELPTTVNTLGEEKDNPGTLTERLLNAMLNPIGVNEYSQSAVSVEMERVREATGETGFYPTTRKPKELSYKDSEGEEHRVELSYEQQQAFQTACAVTQMSYTEAMMSNAHYKGASADEQAALLKRCYDFAYQDAKAGVLGDDAADGWVKHAKNAQREIGLSPTDYLYYYEKYGANIMSGSGYETTCRMKKAGVQIDQWAKMKSRVDADGNSSVSKAEVTAYIEKNFPAGKWSTIFDAYKGSRNWKNPY